MRFPPGLPCFALALGACSAPPGEPPSLAPRAAESIDPRLPVGTPAPAGSVSPALAARLAELIEQARAGEQAFRAAAQEAERLVAAAGAPETEAWVAAQQAISAALAAKAPTTRALGEIDEIAANAVAGPGRISAADFAAVRSAAAEVAAMAGQQNARMDALRARLAD